MFVIQRVRRDEGGYIVAVEGFARTSLGELESQAFGCPVGELVSRIKCGDSVVTIQGGLIKSRRISAAFETIEDLPDTKPGARSIDLPTF